MTSIISAYNSQWIQEQVTSLFPGRQQMVQILREKLPIMGSSILVGVAGIAASFFSNRVSGDQFRNLLISFSIHQKKILAVCTVPLLVPLGLQAFNISPLITIATSITSITSFALLGCLWGARAKMRRGREDLIELVFYDYDLTGANFSRIPDTVKELFLKSCDLTGADFSTIPNGLKKLVFARCDSREDIDLSGVPKGVKELVLRTYDLTDADFSGVPDTVGKLILKSCNLTGADFSTIPNGLKKLIFESYDSTGADFSTIPESVEVEYFY